MGMNQTGPGGLPGTAARPDHSTAGRPCLGSLGQPLDDETSPSRLTLEQRLGGGRYSTGARDVSLGEGGEQASEVLPGSGARVLDHVEDGGGSHALGGLRLQARQPTRDPIPGLAFIWSVATASRH